MSRNNRTYREPFYTWGSSDFRVNYIRNPASNQFLSSGISTSTDGINVPDSKSYNLLSYYKYDPFVDYMNITGTKLNEMNCNMDIDKYRYQKNKSKKNQPRHDHYNIRYNHIKEPYFHE
jgi:hypothetical protein